MPAAGDATQRRDPPPPFQRGEHLRQSRLRIEQQYPLSSYTQQPKRAENVPSKRGRDLFLLIESPASGRGGKVHEKGTKTSTPPAKKRDLVVSGPLPSAREGGGGLLITGEHRTEGEGSSFAGWRSGVSF